MARSQDARLRFALETYRDCDASLVRRVYALSEEVGRRFPYRGRLPLPQPLVRGALAQTRAWDALGRGNCAAARRSALEMASAIRAARLRPSRR